MKRSYKVAGAIAAAALLVGAAATPGAAQAPAGFDPLHPFAGLKTAQEFEKKFWNGKPSIVPGDSYGNMTASQFWRDSWQGQNINHPERTMAGHKGAGGTGVVVRSPYSYKSAKEHFDAWKAAAGGGKRLTRQQLPDWSGDWQGTSDGVLQGNAKVSEVWNAVSEAYKPRFAEILRNEWAGHAWWPTAFCLPYGFGGFYFVNGANWHFMSDQKMVLINKDKNNEETRYIYTDNRGFLPPEKQFPQWYGESQGFWDGDELVVWTAQIKQWVITHGLPEFSSQLQVVERFKRVGDDMLVDITLYDPVAFAFPWHDIAIFHLLKDWTESPSTYQDCVSTNNVYMNKDGELDYWRPGEPGYLDFSDERPWSTAYKRWEALHPNAFKP